jgi:peptide/nickel transport system substrate-binding protein
LAVAAAMAALLLAAGAAEAGKKSGTLNIAIAEQIEGISEFYSPSGESQLYTRVVMDRLFNLDHDTGKILPSLGISWKKINSTTFEIRLRRDITFHDGSKFDADDVVYTINWASNPKTRFRLKGPRFGWIKGAEILGSHKVRLLAKRPFSLAKITLAVGVPILPSDMHSALAKKYTFWAQGGRQRRLQACFPGRKHGHNPCRPR